MREQSSADRYPKEDVAHCGVSHFLLRAVLALFATGLFSGAAATDACSTRAVVTRADVVVSDGTSFATESYFQSRDAAAIRHMREDDRIVVVEGPLAWGRVDSRFVAGTEFHKVFALGHQYHAFILFFEDIVNNPRPAEAVRLGGVDRKATSGDYPYGGVVHRVDGEIAERPAGFVFEFPDTPPIEVMLSDWRRVGERDLPFNARIDDGQRTFEYRYTEVDIGERAPGWFFEAVGKPELDPVLVYRLHRSLLVAHCAGDAGRMAALSADSMTVVSGGGLQTVSHEALRQRFESVFGRLDYTAYHDIVLPVIEVADSGDVGWVGVNVRAQGTIRESGAPFDEQWAWIMMVRKVGDAWLNAGNASSPAR